MHTIENGALTGVIEPDCSMLALIDANMGHPVQTWEGVAVTPAPTSSS